MEQNIKELWDNIQGVTYAYIMGPPEGKNRERSRTTEKSPKLMADIKPHIQKAQRTQKRINFNAPKQQKQHPPKLQLDISYKNFRKLKLKKKS